MPRNQNHPEWEKTYLTQKKSVDPKLVYSLAKLGLKNTQIAIKVGLDESTVRKAYENELKLGRADREISIRLFQWEACKRGNPALLIFVGKNELGQADAPNKIELSGPDGGPVEVNNGKEPADYDTLTNELLKLAATQKSDGRLPSDN